MSFLLPGVGIGPFNLGYVGVHFDGTNDYLAHSAEYGASDKTASWTYSLWVNHAADGVAVDYHYGTGSIHQLAKNAGNQVRFNSYGPGGSGSRNYMNSGSYLMTISDGWTWIGLCSDGTAGGSHMFFNDVSVGTNTSNSTSSEDNTIGGWIGASTAGSNKMAGDMAEFYLNLDDYIDLSVLVNRRKFYSADGGFVDLGADGSIPSGNQPHVYLSCRGDPSTFKTNLGDGGDFTEVGALTLSATNP